MASSNNLFKTHGSALFSPLAFLLAGFCLLSWVYSTLTPIFEAPDEWPHFQFVRHLARGGDLPQLQVGVGLGVAEQEGGQGPLYYATGAALTFWAFPPENRKLQLHPHSGPGAPSSAGAKNVWLHNPEDEDFPGRGQFLAARLLRLLSGLFGVITALASYATAREIWPRRRYLAFGAAAITALNPQFIFLSGAVTNEIAAAAGGGVCVWLGVRLLRRGISVRHLLAFGSAVGVALLAKASVGPVAAVLGAAAIWQIVRQAASGGQKALYLAIVSAPPLAIAGWWYARNWLLYGDPTALGISAIIAGGGTANTQLGEIISDLDGLKAVVLGVFGAFNIVADTPYYWIFDALMALAVLGLAWRLVWLWRRRRNPEFYSLVLLAIATLLIFGALVRWRFLTLGFQGRLLFPAITAISVLLVAGIAAWAPARAGRWLVFSVSLILAGVAVAAPLLYIAPAYARPARLSAQQVALLPSAPAARFGNELELLGTEAPAQRPPGSASVPLTLYWRAVRPLTTDYSIFLHLTAPGGSRWGQMDTYPGLGMYPTSQWQAGEVLKVSYRVPLAPDTPPSNTLLLSLGVYQVDTWSRLDVRSSLWQLPDHQVVLGKLLSSASPPTPVVTVFGDQIGLVAFNLDSLKAAPGGAITGQIRWQALRPANKDFTVFLHLVGPDGRVAQYDGQPLGGRYPISRWDVGEIVSDAFRIPIPTNVPSGEYSLVTGFYDLATGERLPVGEGSAFELARVRID